MYVINISNNRLTLSPMACLKWKIQPWSKINYRLSVTHLSFLIAPPVFITLRTEFSAQHVLIKSLGDLPDIVLVTSRGRGNFMANLFVTSVSKGRFVATFSTLRAAPARLILFEVTLFILTCTAMCSWAPSWSCSFQSALEVMLIINQL